MVGQHLVLSRDENLTLPAIAHRAREVGSPRGCGVHPGHAGARDGFCSTAQAQVSVTW